MSSVIKPCDELKPMFLDNNHVVLQHPWWENVVKGDCIWISILLGSLWCLMCSSEFWEKNLSTESMKFGMSVMIFPMLEALEQPDCMVCVL